MLIDCDENANFSGEDLALKLEKRRRFFHSFLSLFCSARVRKIRSSSSSRPQFRRRHTLTKREMSVIGFGSGPRTQKLFLCICLTCTYFADTSDYHELEVKIAAKNVLCRHFIAFYDLKIKTYIRQMMFFSSFLFLIFTPDKTFEGWW